MDAKKLRELTEKSKVQEAEQLWVKLKDIIFKEMEKAANNRQSSFKITHHHETLNVDGWLSKPHIYKKFKEEFESLGYHVEHEDSMEDGTYMHIQWFK